MVVAKEATRVVVEETAWILGKEVAVEGIASGVTEDVDEVTSSRDMMEMVDPGQEGSLVVLEDPEGPADDAGGVREVSDTASQRVGVAHVPDDVPILPPDVGLTSSLVSGLLHPVAVEDSDAGVLEKTVNCAQGQFEETPDSKIEVECGVYLTCSKEDNYWKPQINEASIKAYRELKDVREKSEDDSESKGVVLCSNKFKDMLRNPSGIHGGRGEEKRESEGFSRRWGHGGCRVERSYDSFLNSVSVSGVRPGFGTGSAPGGFGLSTSHRERYSWVSSGNGRPPNGGRNDRPSYTTPGKIKRDDNQDEKDDCSLELMNRESVGESARRKIDEGCGVADYVFDYEVVGSRSSAAQCSVTNGPLCLCGPFEAGTTGIGNRCARVEEFPENTVSRGEEGSLDRGLRSGYLADDEGLESDIGDEKGQSTIDTGLPELRPSKRRRVVRKRDNGCSECDVACCGVKVDRVKLGNKGKESIDYLMKDEGTWSITRESVGQVCRKECNLRAYSAREGSNGWFGRTRRSDVPNRYQSNIVNQGAAYIKRLVKAGGKMRDVQSTDEVVPHWRYAYIKIKSNVNIGDKCLLKYQDRIGYSDLWLCRVVGTFLGDDGLVHGMVVEMRTRNRQCPILFHVTKVLVRHIFSI